MIWLENLAEKYLHRRGRFALPRAFVGVAIGFCVAEKINEDNEHFDVYRVAVPKHGRWLVVNHSQLISKIVTPR